MDARFKIDMAWADDTATEPEARSLQAARLEALGRRTSSIVHDFNNLLMVVQGNVAILRRNVKDSELRPHLDAIHEVGERARQLARELLTYARGGECGTETLDLADTVENSLPTVRQLVGSDVEVRWRRSSERAFVDICPVQLDAAVLNLAANARDAMDSRGVLELAVSADADHVVLVVSDTGAGMPPEILSRVFDAFFTTKAAGKGTGLGLTQVNDVIRNAGGAAHIESTVGEGTTITLRLPRLEAPPEREDVAPRPPERESRRVLLVDDDVAARATVAAYLRQSAMTVREAGCGVEALGMLDAEPFDTLVSDVAMPGELDGLGLARAARARRPALEILLMSGDARCVADATAKGFVGLSKPFDLTELERRLRAKVLSG